MKAKILVAEDDLFLVKAYQAKLTKEGWEVAIAINGEEAMHKVRSEKPDLILLDLVMPKKDGFEVLEELKDDKDLSKIPVIILSNLGQESDVERGKALGAVDYIIKTDLSIQNLVKKIKEILAKYKAK